MKKVGILTFHRALNYGAILQAYALAEKIGDRAEIIDYSNPDSFEKDYSLNFFKRKGIKGKIKGFLKWIVLFKINYKTLKKNRKLRIFIKEKLVKSPKLNKDNIEEYVNENIFKIIVGSDQVWNMEITNGDTTYLLDFCKDNSKKNSYAASFGGYEKFDKEKINYLKQFKTITVREEAAKRTLALFGVGSKVVLDPTFLHDRNYWLDFSKDVNPIKEKYILIYTVTKANNLYDKALEYAKKHNCKIYTLSEIRKKIFKRKNVMDASVEEFINYINNAYCVFTTSFHGIALSINLNKNFYYELGKEKVNNNSRINNIIEALGISDREILDNHDLVEKNIMWDEVNRKLGLLRRESMQSLEDLLRDE